MSGTMKNFILVLSLSILVLVLACQKENKSDKFTLLTSPAWVSDSLLVNGTDASGAGQMLNKFVGDIKFKDDGTGYFGKYTGKWRFAYDETEIIIESDSLLVPISAIISELNSKSLKLNTNYPNPLNLLDPFKIRMTFKVK
jgi:hypothetical protein